MYVSFFPLEGFESAVFGKENLKSKNFSWHMGKSSGNINGKSVLLLYKGKGYVMKIRIYVIVFILFFLLFAGFAGKPTAKHLHAGSAFVRGRVCDTGKQKDRPGEGIIWRILL